MSTTTTREVELENLSVESVERIRVTITKDGVAWNLSSGSVVFVFESPSGTQFSRNGVAEDAVNGIFYYDTTVTDITAAGYWKLGLTVTDGAVVKSYPYPITFYAADEP